MQTIRRLTYLVQILIFIAASILSLRAAPLDSWLVNKIKEDEQKIEWMLRGQNGYDVALLPSARWYQPFFLERPSSIQDVGIAYLTNLDDYFEQERKSGYLPGGYIYRLRFTDAPPLYATSAGDWELETWHSLDLNKDIIVESASVWNGSGDDYLFATMLAGVRPKIVVYDQHGEVKREEIFDVNDADFEQRMAAAEQTYVRKGSPILEMLSLAEYLENPDASWREADLSGHFNLRNQQQRDVERERLKSALHLTRNAAIEALQSGASPQEQQRPHASSEPMPVPQAPDPIKSPKAEPTPVGESPPPPRWPVVAGVVVAVLGLLWLLLKKRK